MLDKLLVLWGKLPTTQARVTVTLGSVFVTTARYAASGIRGMESWEPSYEWLLFLAVMSGLDLKQFQVKRTTDDHYVAAKAGIPIEPRDEPPTA